MVLAAMALAACSDAAVNVLAPIGPCRASAAGAEEARPADAFVDSVAVGTFLHYGGTPYDNPTRVAELLRALGVRHLVDPGASSTARSRAGTIAAAANLRVILSINSEHDVVATAAECVGRPSCRTAGAIARELGPALEAFSVSSDAADRIDPAWVSRTRERLTALRAELSADPATRHVELIAPGADDAREVEALRPLADVASYAGLRWRFAPGPPGEALDVAFQQYASAYGARPKHLGTVFWFTGTGDGAVSERVQAKYYTRVLLETFSRRIARTHLHELLDPTAQFLSGTLRRDLTPKASYTALQRMLTLLADPGQSFLPGGLAFTLEPPQPTVRHLLLSKRSGAFYLVLWREVRSRDEDTTVPVEVVLGTRATEVELFQPLASADPIARFARPERISVMVPDHPVILKLTPVCP